MKTLERPLHNYLVDFTERTDVLPGFRWHLAAYTSRQATQDLFAAGEEPLLENPETYCLSPISSVILLVRRLALIATK